MEMKAGDKYCPIDTHPWEIDSLCKKEQCAWWDDITGHCAILNISRHGALGSFDIAKKERGAK